MERATGLEPVSSAWKATALPLDDTRTCQRTRWHRRPESNRRDAALDAAPGAMPSPANWVDRPDLPRRVPAPQAGASLLGHGQHTMGPRIGIKPTSTAYNAALTFRSTGRRSRRVSNPLLPAYQAGVRPVELHDRELGPVSGLEPPRTNLRGSRAATRTPPAQWRR